jgi:hypothetical protein
MKAVLGSAENLTGICAQRKDSVSSERLDRVHALIGG